eukprot:jgi/Ulvmu1/12901/UM098_0089.1
MSSHRPPRYGALPAQIDPEAQEQENDEGIELMTGKAVQLREIATDLLGEVRTQVGMLDRIDASATGANGMLKSSLAKFNKVFSNGENRLLAYVVGACIVVFVLCYWAFKR